MPETHLTKCELEVMNVVWDRGPVTVQDVVAALERTLAYTTVMTTLKILDTKRRVVRKTKQGRAFLYEAAVTREEINRGMASQLTQTLFGGSAKALVMCLLEGQSMSPSDIAELKRAIAAVESEL